MSTLVCPGDRIGSADVYRAGSGTYERHGGIFAACCGQAQDATSSSGERLLQVTAPQDIKSAIPKPGAVVTVKVTRVQQTSASCKVLVVGSTAVSKEFSGIIRLQDVRSTEIDKVVLHHCFRPGDIVRAEVLSLGDARSYYLTTAKNELGVVYAKSSAGVPMVAVGWEAMQCPMTRVLEPRKVAATQPEGNPSASPAP
ncbi:S1 motif domain-containing protein [Haematococcus lacustris]|uniref:S1 motif domain-containing protein n=1 Tax=Haematococcus lacustris TaxID=44745 RepID=A0A699YHN8_HAELA|nr:S1 motif domain-containing protein [Haematococcus lacustris]